MSSIAALDRRCFLARPQTRRQQVPERCFVAGRVPLRPQAIREFQLTARERQAVPA